MDRQLFSVIVVFAAFGVNAILILFSESFSFRRDCPVCPVLDDSTEAGIKYNRIASLEYALKERENTIIQLNKDLENLKIRLSKANKLQQRTERILSSAKDELSACLLSPGTRDATQSGKVTDTTVVIAPETTHVEKSIMPDFGSLLLTPSAYDWSHVSHYYEESVKKDPPMKVWLLAV